ncbi:MAG: hypothetical protein V4511_07795 [Bacteroidota bacterium]
MAEQNYEGAWGLDSFGRFPFLKKKGAGFTFQSSPIKIGEGFPLQSLTQNFTMKENFQHIKRREANYLRDINRSGTAYCYLT